MQNGTQITLNGNYLTGVKAKVNSSVSQDNISNDVQESNTYEFEIIQKSKWYEILLSILPFILILVWGNSVALCQIVPVVGGAIGGLVSAVFAIGNMVVIRKVKQVWLKVLISIVTLGLTFLVCYLIALIILSI